MPGFRLLVVAFLVLIVFNLTTALYHLSTERSRNDPAKSAKLVRALTWRIGLSISLFLLILFAWSQGCIQPHRVGG